MTRWLVVTPIVAVASLGLERAFDASTDIEVSGWPPLAGFPPEGSPGEALRQLMLTLLGQAYSVMLIWIWNEDAQLWG